jgi:hypothetical protein
MQIKRIAQSIALIATVFASGIGHTADNLLGR